MGLGEQERRSLVKVEKENVLKKMKDQQKHSCGCAVCGRKRLVSSSFLFISLEPFDLDLGNRLLLSLDIQSTLPDPLPPFSTSSNRTAIEEELEVLYDAYYDELEQYANHQQEYAASGGTIPPPAGPGPFPGSVELDRNGALIRPDHLAPQQPKPLAGVPISQQPGKWARRSAPGNPDDEGDEEDEEEDEEYSDDGGEDDEEVSLGIWFETRRRRRFDEFFRKTWRDVRMLTLLPLCCYWLVFF